MKNNTRFEKVIDYLQENQGLKQADIARTIGKTVTGINEVQITRLKKGKSCPPEDVINAMHDYYKINPDYLKGTSDVMLDGAGIILEKFNEIFSKWSTTLETTYRDSDGNEITNTFLHVTMKECYYNFLKKVDHAKFLQEQGMHSFDAELEECKKECNNTEDEEWEYLILPKNSFMDIVTTYEQNKKAFDEIIDLDKYVSPNADINKLNINCNKSS